MADIIQAGQAVCDDLLKEDEVAKMLQVSVGTLKRWRCAGDGPPFISLGDGPKARKRYDREDVKKYVAGIKRSPSVRAH